MVKLWHKIWAKTELHLRCCIKCRKIIGITDVMCADCWNSLDKFRAINSNYLHHSFPLFHLYNWDKTNHADISRLIYALKGGKLPAAFEHIAWLLTTYRLKYALDKKNLVFIPIPGNLPNAEDHAASLCKSLSKVFQAPTLNGLIRLSHISQKTLDKNSRTQIQFKQNYDIKDENRSKKIILIDDVVTSGATALAAYNALKKPRLCEFWAIAWRIKTNDF